MADTPTCSEYSIEVPAPKDADGRKVPLDTKVMYNASGDEFDVRWFTYSTGPYCPGWSVKVYDPLDTIALNLLRIEKPDSLKQLAEDLNRMWSACNELGLQRCGDMPCHYDRGRGKYCNDCRLNSHGKMMCFDAMMADIVSRVNRLAGDSE